MRGRVLEICHHFLITNNEPLLLKCATKGWSLGELKKKGNYYLNIIQLLVHSIKRDVRHGSLIKMSSCVSRYQQHLRAVSVYAKFLLLLYLFKSQVCLG